MIKLLIEKIVKYDENDMASIYCPVCNHREYSVILSKEGRTTLFCRNDDFQLTRLPDLSFTTDYTVYLNMGKEFTKKRDKELYILFNKGLITYVTLVGIVAQFEPKAIRGVF